MKSKLIAAAIGDGRRTFAVILETGDEFTRCMMRFGNEEKVTTRQFTAIGAFSSGGRVLRMGTYRLWSQG